MKVKKNLRKVKRKVINIYKKIKFKFKRKMTLEKICNLLEIEVPKELRKVRKLRVDEITRSKLDIKDNCIFFCKNLTRFKEYEELIKEKSICIFSEEPLENCNNIVLPDTFNAYTTVMKYIKNLVNPRVVAITGSIGKTSTKDMVKSVLKRKYKNMFASSGNSNSYYKVTKNIKNLSYLDKVFLQEVGLGKEKILFKENSIMLEPEVVIYTNILDSHIEHFGSRENIAKYKTQLSKYGKEDGLTIINYDDEILRKTEFKQQVLSYSLNNKKATYYAKDINITAESTNFVIVDTKEDSCLEVELKVIGEHHIQNALAAYAVGKYFKMKDKSILNGLKKYKTSGMRQNIISIGDYTVFADCYNASYDSIETAVKTMEVLETKDNGEKLAVIGDIFSLGEFSSETHKKVGKMLSEYNLDKIYFFGNEMKKAYNEYSKLKSNSKYFSDRDQLHAEIEKDLKPGDIILFKASHGMHLTESIDFIFGTDMADGANIGENDYKEVISDNYKYYEFPHNATIIGYAGEEKKLILPEKLQNKPINKLGKEVFKNNENVEKIVLSSKISRIRKECFMNSNIKEVVFNKSLKSIGTRAFYNCNNIKEVVLPDNMIFIDSEAFANCSNLKTIVIPRSVKKVSKTAFANCSKLTIFGLKNSYIEKYAKEHSIAFKKINNKK